MNQPGEFRWRKTVRRFAWRLLGCCLMGLLCHLLPGWWGWEKHRMGSFLYGILGGGFKYFCYVHPYLGKITMLTNIFQRSWNHQPVYIYIPPWNVLLGRWNLIPQIWYSKWCHETRYIFHPAQHFWYLNMDVLLVDWIWHIWHRDSWRMTIWKDYLNFAWACISAWWKTVLWTFHTDQVLMRLFFVQICYAELDP